MLSNPILDCESGKKKEQQRKKVLCYSEHRELGEKRSKESANKTNEGDAAEIKTKAEADGKRISRTVGRPLQCQRLAEERRIRNKVNITFGSLNFALCKPFSL